MKRRDFLKLPAKLAAMWGVAKSGVIKLPEEVSEESTLAGGASIVSHLDEISVWHDSPYFSDAWNNARRAEFSGLDDIITTGMKDESK